MLLLRLLLLLLAVVARASITYKAINMLTVGVQYEYIVSHREVNQCFST